MTTVALSWALATAVLGANPEPAHFALVVAHNNSRDASVAPLRFADDDGARFAELMLARGASVELLVLMDPETQGRFPALVERAEPPTKAALRAAMDRILVGVEAARAEGRPTELHFFFAGHGHVGDDREGYVDLVDGRFGRSALYREVIARSSADLNHVVIDACNAYFMVNRRGDAEAAVAALNAFLASESLDRYPNTGVILSTASEQEVHEWSRYQSGVFSHQLLSALAGAADVDGDGAVRYAEAHAFIAAANHAVRDPRARLSVFARAPAKDVEAPLMRAPAAERAAWVELPAALAGRVHLEDDRGLRVVDVHKSAEQPLRLALVPRGHYFVRTPGAELKLAAAAGSSVRVSESALTPRELAERGAVEESFRRDLFAVPFGRGFVAGFESAGESPREVAALSRGVALDWYERPRPWAWVSGGLALAGIGAGVGLSLAAADKRDELEAGVGSLSMAQAIALQDEEQTLRTGAGVAFGVGGALALTATILALLEDPGAPPDVVVGVDGEGVRVGGRF